MKDEVKNALEKEHGYESDSSIKDTAHSLRANLKVKKRDSETGTLKEAQEVKNIITDEGAEYVRDTVGNAPNTSAMRWTAIGQSRAAFASTDGTLNSETARSKNAFNTTANHGQFSNVTTFTNVAATIKESGLFNDNAADQGTMLAAQTFGDITLTTADSLEVIWKVYFSEV